MPILVSVRDTYYDFKRFVLFQDEYIKNGRQFPQSNDLATIMPYAHM